MGRNLFRRQIVIIIILIFIQAGVSFGNTLFEEIKRGPSTPLYEKALPSRQSHKGKAVYSMDIPDNKHIRRYIKEYFGPGGLDHLAVCLERGKKYRGYIRNRLEEEDLPYELIFLPVIESSYYNYAYSYMGAAGLWQFIYSTGAMYGLKVTEWLDERRDFMKATDAALKMLKFHYKLYGDWNLALAAYNCGAGRLNNIISRAGTKDYWELVDKGYLPTETANYVAKFLAVAAISSHKGRVGLPLSWDTDQEWDAIPLTFAVDLRILSRKSGVPYDILNTGNPELNLGITPYPAWNYSLKVPARYTEAVKKTIADNGFNLIKYHIYYVEYGDTLYSLSRHYDVSVAMIQQYNPGVYAHNLKLGKRLIIPSFSDVEPYERIKDTSNLAYNGTHVVERGESLWTISKKYKAPPDELAQMNGLTMSSILRPGAKLKVPVN